MQLRIPHAVMESLQSEYQLERREVVQKLRAALINKPPLDDDQLLLPLSTLRFIAKSWVPSPPKVSVGDPPPFMQSIGSQQLRLAVALQLLSQQETRVAARRPREHHELKPPDDRSSGGYREPSKTSLASKNVQSLVDVFDQELERAMGQG
jgi:hypothetical protein